MVNEMHGKQANLVDWTGGQAKWAVHVSYQIFPKPPILCLHALLDGCENTGVSGTAWSLVIHSSEGNLEYRATVVIK